MSGVINGVNETSDKTGEEKMKNLMILTFLLIFAVGCKSEVVEEAPVKDVHEMTDEEIKKEVF